MKLKPPSFLSRGRGAFALVVVLIVISVLALVAVGFLSSMGQERATASAFANKTRAEQSAQSGVDTAMGILRDYFKAFPDSATAWDPAQSTNDDGISNEGTTLYLRAVSTLAAGGDTNTDSPDPAPGATADPTTYKNADYIHGNGPNNVDPTTGVDNRKIFVLPLVSGATVKRLENKANAVRETGDTSNPPRKLKANASVSPSNSFNLNARRSLADTTGWLGTPPGYTSPTNASGGALPKPFTVPWVEIKQQDGVTNPANAPVIGRYAFWIEDESFRANINYAGLGNSHSRRDNSQNYLLNPTDSDLLGIMTSAGLGSSTATQYAQNLFDLRANYPGNLFLEPLAFTHAKDFDAATLNPLRYLTTVSSSGLNLTRHGTQRLNLNAPMTPVGVTPATPIATTLPTETSKIQFQIDTLVKTLEFHAPNFGQRLFRFVPGNSGGGMSAPISSGSVTDPRILNQMAVSHDANSTAASGNYARIYFYKTAANIRDQIDADAFPTCVLAGGTVRPQSAPQIPFGDSGDNPVWAIGKDSSPFISECAVRPRGTITGNNFDMFIDYYIEVWNMSNRDIKGSDLGPSPFIKVSNPTRWKVGKFTAYNTTSSPTATGDLVSDDSDGVSPSSTRPTSTARDYKIDLSQMYQNNALTPTSNNVLFPAGKVTVITTDRTWNTVISANEAVNNIVACPWLGSGKSEYKGHFPDGWPTGNYDILYMILETSTGTTTTNDLETDITFGSDWGYIDCLQGALPLTGSSYPRVQIPGTGASGYPTLFGGVLRGNWYNVNSATPSQLQASTLGDPRTNNEQLSYNLSTTTATDYSRFQAYDTPTGNNTFSPPPSPTYPASQITQTLGLPNYRSVRPNRPENPWPDFPPYYAVSPQTIASPTAAELVLTADKAPMPVANAALTSIGQLGDVFDPSRQIEGGYQYSRGGGRSFKIGQHDDRWDGDQTSASRSWAAWRLADIFSITDAIQQPGLINVNGILRDNGAALRAALTGLDFQPTPLGDLKLHPPTGNNATLNVDQLIVELKARLSQSSLNTDGSANTGGTTTVGASTYPLQTGAGPFWERGELSEVRGFGRTPDPIKSGSGTQLSGTVTYTQPATASEPGVFITGTTKIDPSSQLFDRGREELFRRLVEMTTTRGNVFTVYAVGQAITQSDPNNVSTRKVTGTHQLKVTFRLVPKGPNATGVMADFQPATVFSSFDPNDSANLRKQRFGKPDHYDIEVLSVSSSSD